MNFWIRVVLAPSSHENKTDDTKQKLLVMVTYLFLFVFSDEVDGSVFSISNQDRGAPRQDCTTWRVTVRLLSTAF
jgi:hypothetical protein